MTVEQAMKILEEEIEARKSANFDYDTTVTDAMEIVLDYAKRSAPR
jgi:hypothetical protein